jgi:hypothetical protein
MLEDIVKRLRGARTNGVLCKAAADEIESLRVAYDQALATIKDISEEVQKLRNAGDVLAATGGQHGFDAALDNWKEKRENDS